MAKWLVEIDETALEAAASKVGALSVDETVELALRCLLDATCPAG